MDSEKKIFVVCCGKKYRGSRVSHHLDMICEETTLNMIVFIRSKIEHVIW